MIVPFAQGPAAKPPSETDMLVALATMHKMGRIAKPATPKAKAPDDTPPKGAPIA